MVERVVVLVVSGVVVNGVHTCLSIVPKAGSTSQWSRKLTIIVAKAAVICVSAASVNEGLEFSLIAVAFEGHTCLLRNLLRHLP